MKLVGGRYDGMVLDLVTPGVTVQPGDRVLYIGLPDGMEWDKAVVKDPHFCVDAETHVIWASTSATPMPCQMKHCRDRGLDSDSRWEIYLRGADGAWRTPRLAAGHKPYRP